MYTGQVAAISNKATWVSQVLEAIDEQTLDQADLSDPALVVDVEVTIKDVDGCTRATATLANGKAAIVAPAPAGIQWQFEVTDLSALCAGTYRLGVKLTINNVVTDLVDGTIAILEGN